MIQRFLEIGRQIGSARKIESLAIQVALSSLEGARLRIVGGIATMTTSEARGFIRARAGQEVRCQTRILLARQRAAGSDWESRVARRATEKVIPMVLRLRHDLPSIPLPSSVAA